MGLRAAASCTFRPEPALSLRDFKSVVLAKLKRDYGIVPAGHFDVNDAINFIAGFHAASDDTSKCAFCLANRRE